MPQSLKCIVLPLHIPIYRSASEILAQFRLRRLAKKGPRRIVIGAAGTAEDGWISTERQILDLLKPRDWERYFSSNSIEAILAEHVWEHLTIEEGYRAASVCFRYLRPGGYVRVAVPDGLHPDPTYMEYVRPGGVGCGADDHKILYTYMTFKQVFELAGFRVDLLEYFDEIGEFHYKEWNPNDGMIRRSRRFDKRNDAGNLCYTSIILDARK